MRRRTFLATATAFVATARAAQADTYVVNSPGDGYLNLRTGPGSNYAIIRPMTHGSTVETLEWAGNWVRVRHASGDVGWAFAKYLGRAVSPYKQVYSPSDGYLNLRTGPGTQYNIIRRMYNWEGVKLLEIKGNWARVRHDSGATGWAHRRYLVD